MRESHEFTKILEMQVMFFVVHVRCDWRSIGITIFSVELFHTSDLLLFCSTEKTSEGTGIFHDRRLRDRRLRDRRLPDRRFKKKTIKQSKTRGFLRNVIILSLHHSSFTSDDKRLVVDVLSFS